MNILKSDRTTWIDIRKPVKSDINYLREHYPFESHTLEALLAPTLRPSVESNDGYLYVVLHFPIYDADAKVTHSRELDIIVTHDTLITVTYNDIRPLAEFQMKCNSAGVHQAYCLGKSAAHLLFYIIDALFQFALRELDHVQSTLDDIDERIFDGNEKNLVERISIVRRDILSFRKTLKPQKIVLESLVRHGVAFFGARSQALFRDMLGEYSRVWDVLENHKETAESLHDTNESLLSTKSTETMRTLTIFAVITFPLTLFATLFAMDTVATPIRGNPYDFWIIAGIMLFVVLCMILYFKRKRWI